MRRTRAAAEQTRERILDAAEHVFFEEGVARSTLEQIARAGAVTRGAIYWHFENKADLFNAVVERVRMPLESALHRVLDTADTLDDLEDLCTAALLQLHHNARLRRVYTILYLKCEHTEDMTEIVAREQSIKDENIKSLTHFFARLQDRDQITYTGKPHILATSLYAYVIGLHVDYLGSPHRYRMPNDASALVGCYFEPLKIGRIKTQ
ncbi:TetR family transcriptional regulator [Haliea atlantica]